MQRIVHIIEASATGTLAMAALLANGQARAGHSVTVIYSRRPETPPDLGIHFDAGVGLLHLQMTGALRGLIAIFALRRLLIGLKPDAVILHSSMAGFIGRIAVSAGNIKAKVLYLPHCISFMRRDIGAGRRWLFTALEKMAARFGGIYVACSHSEFKEIQGAVPRSDCVLVENAINFGTNALEEVRGTTDEVMIVTVGQLRTQKRPLLFAEICELVRKKIPTARFVWVGDGDERLKAAIECRGVSVTGWKDPRQVRSYLQKATLYLSTSSWEGMPVSIIEANYAGACVVAAECAGNIDVVTHGETGLLYQAAEDAAKYILSLIDDPARARELAGRAKAAAQQRFSTERYLAKMGAILNGKMADTIEAP